MQKLTVNLGEKSYDILIEEGLLARAAGIIKENFSPAKAIIITDENVANLYRTTLEETFLSELPSVKILTVPAGETTKSLDSANKLYSDLFAHKMDRKSFIIAVGGGVVGDLAGFLAATYMRGIAFIQIPTTLLADVDSSVGGKTGVNHAIGKNLIGAFHQPKMVIIDPKLLTTLPEREFSAGMAEVIKYGVILDEELFALIESNVDELKANNAAILSEVIYRSCQLKAYVVERDEKEQGLRAILNYGHTVGHAIEALTNYSTYLHGEAIAIGMIAASYIAKNMSLITQDEITRQEHLLDTFDLPVRYKAEAIDAVIEKLYLDKKTIAGKLRFIIPEKIGTVRIVEDVPRELIQRSLKEAFNG